MNVQSIFSTVAKKFSRWYQSRANGFRSIGAGPVIGAMLALALCGPIGVQAGTVSFQQGVGGYSGTQDTSIAYDNNGSPPVPNSINNNYGGEADLASYSRDGVGSSIQNVNNMLISFDLTSLAPNVTTVTAATLTLYQTYSGGDTSITNSLYTMVAADAGWTQGTGTGQAGVPGATWNYKDGASLANWASGAFVGSTGPSLVAGTDYNATPVATANSSPAHLDDRTYAGGGYAVTFSLNSPAALAAIDNWIDNPSQNAGFFSAQATNSESVDFFASNSSFYEDSMHPLLTLTTVVVPEPSTLVLAGIAGVLMLSWRRRSKISRSCGGQANGFRSICSGPVIGAILALALCGSSSIQANTISFQNGVSGYTGTRDTYIAGGANAVNNYGTDTVLGIYERETATSNFDRTLIGYDLSSVTPGTTVTGATLTLYQQYGGGNQGVINSLYVLAAADAGWTQSGATWNNTNGPSTPWAGGSGLSAPNDYSTPVATEASPGTGFADLRGVSGVPMTFTLDAAGIAVIQDWINNPADNSGFFIRQPDGSFSVDLFASSSASNAASLHPLLTLTTVPEPSTLVLAGIAGVLMLSWRRRSK